MSVMGLRCGMVPWPTWHGEYTQSTKKQDYYMALCEAVAWVPRLIGVQGSTPKRYQGQCQM